MVRTVCAAFLILVVSAGSLMAGPEEQTLLDGRPWRDLPVQNGGRRKPLDTLAWELLRVLSNRSSFTDPETGASLDPTAWYLAMVFDWQGWDNRDRDQLRFVTDWRPQYFRLHKPDKWDNAPLLRVDYLELRSLLDMDQDQKYIAPAELARAVVEDSRTGKPVPFVAWTEQLAQREAQGKSLTRLEQKGLELADHLAGYQNHRMGRGLELLPLKGSATGEWMSMADLLLARFDAANDPTGQYGKLQALLVQSRTAYHNTDAATLTRTAEELKAELRELGTVAGNYPGAFPIGLEVTYNHAAPFRFAWIFLCTAAVLMLLHLGTGWRLWNLGAFTSYAAGLLALLTGFALRITISGRPPVTNMYESVVYVGLGVAVLGLIFELIYRKKYILTAAASVSAVALVLADSFPAMLDPSMRPLEPVLRSNFWLVVHVMTITLSYAAFALTLGIANVTLGYYLFRSANQAVIAALTRFTYRAMQVGVLLLAAGIILGGVWADYSWGRFWGWDPKEVWALVALLGYLCVLHARFAGWVGQRGLAALSVTCFSLVVMAWYGVNFVLGAGLHSYGFGGGGQGWVYSAVLVQFGYAGLALFRSRTPVMQQTPPLPTETPQVQELRIGTPASAEALPSLAE